MANVITDDITRGRPPVPTKRKKKPKKQGRKRERKLTAVLQIRADPQRIVSYRAAARRDGMSVSEWLRRHVNSAAASEKIKSERKALLLVRAEMNAVMGYCSENLGRMPADAAVHVSGRVANIRDRVADVITSMTKRL